MSKKKEELKKEADTAQPTEGPDALTQFYLVILHPDGEFGRETHKTLDSLTERLKALVNQDVSVFAFSGTQLHISKPPFRHLLTPWGPKPLFDIDKNGLEPDDTGYLGVDPIHLAPPPVLKTPDSAALMQNSKDEFFDNDDSSPGGFAVFDNILPDPDS